jgi:signal transduction histidine kinase
LPQEVETTIFRIVQEALTNIHRHSGSKNAFLRIEHSSGNTQVEIRDQGRGIAQFDSSKNRPMKVGVGIQGMQERVRQLHGNFEIRSSASGTAVLVTLPGKSAERTLARESEIA